MKEPTTLRSMRIKNSIDSKLTDEMKRLDRDRTYIVNQRLKKSFGAKSSGENESETQT